MVARNKMVTMEDLEEVVQTNQVLQIQDSEELPPRVKEILVETHVAVVVEKFLEAEAEALELQERAELLRVVEAVHLDLITREMVEMVYKTQYLELLFGMQEVEAEEV